LCNCRRTDEDEARELLARLQQTGTVWEVVVAVVRVLNLSASAAAEAIETYLALMGIVVVAVPPDTVRVALDAYDRFGKGRHRRRAGRRDDRKGG